MKSYKFESIFSFGKFKGKSLREVIEIQPSYLNWCVINLDHFHMPNETLEEIKSILPMFSFSEEEHEKNELKYSNWEKENKQEEDQNIDQDMDSQEDFTDWTNYNDNLDMDQQSIEFWNQF